jgi:hypothetical protein
MTSKVSSVDYDIVLAPLRTCRGEICARGKNVEVARGMLHSDETTRAINELLRQRRAYLFNRETKIRTIEYAITTKK